MMESFWFWILLAVFNALYFLPRYLLEAGDSTFIPLPSSKPKPLYNRLRHLFIRPNYDIFRICVDLWIVVFLYIFFFRDFVPAWAYGVFFYVFLGTSLIYQVYHNVFEKLYQIEPVIYSDSFMLKNAFAIFFHEYDRKNFFITVASILIAGLMAVLTALFVKELARVEISTLQIILFSIVLIAGIFSAWHYSYRKYCKTVFQFPLITLMRNLWLSYKTRRELAHLTLEGMKRYNPDASEQLAVCPNIYFIVVESYGRVLYDNPDFREEYLGSLDAFHERLQASGIAAASRFTVSPVTAGASWVSYTSILYGLNVKNQSIYLSLMKNKRIHEYRSLFWWLKDHGYKTFRLSNLGGYETMKIPYDDYSRLYGIDAWIKYQDLGYTGKLYGFGPSPPDQYALWFARKEVEKHVQEPYALFFITQNSHTPYESPEIPADNWEDLLEPAAEMGEQSKFWSKPDFAHYTVAIRYQLDYLTDFIVKTASRNDLFVLVGDHQPPSLSIPIDEFDTPMHVISRDSALVEAFVEEGFEHGLRCREDAIPVRQEALYSIIRRALLRRFGAPGAQLPDVLSEGIPFDQ